jgi:hypothetical protein
VLLILEYSAKASVSFTCLEYCQTETDTKTNIEPKLHFKLIFQNASIFRVLLNQQTTSDYI